MPAKQRRERAIAKFLSKVLLAMCNLLWSYGNIHGEANLNRECRTPPTYYRTKSNTVLSHTSNAVLHNKHRAAHMSGNPIAQIPHSIFQVSVYRFSCVAIVVGGKIHCAIKHEMSKRNFRNEQKQRTNVKDTIKTLGIYSHVWQTIFRRFNCAKFICGLCCFFQLLFSANILRTSCTFRRYI